MPTYLDLFISLPDVYQDLFIAGMKQTQNDTKTAMQQTIDALAAFDPNIYETLRAQFAMQPAPVDGDF